MVIREYNDADEQAWLHCRVVSFLDCSYYNDVKTEKECYSHASISLVAEHDNMVIGLIDFELDSEDVMYNDKGRNAILWHMAVLPQYRHMGIARKLWERAFTMLKEAKITYCELWTQEDVAANTFYQNIGFTLDESKTWLR